MTVYYNLILLKPFRMNKELNDISLRTKRTHATQCDEEGGLTLLFDFGGTLDTAGCHWGKFLGMHTKETEFQ